MTNEQFSLHWDNFHSNMSNGLSSLLKSEDLVDVTLAVEGRYLKAHKMILSVCSPYFKELFQVNPCKHPIVILKDVSYSVLRDLLQFMYQGEVKVCQDDLGTFIKTAEALKIKGLTGDTSNQIEVDAEATVTPVQNNVAPTEPSSSTTFTRKTLREKSPPARKKMLGPASKRFKSETEFSQNKVQQPQPQPTHTETQPEQQTQATLENDSEPKNPPPLAPLTTFKLEPEETAVSLANDEDITYDESAMDELGMDNTTDYMMDSNEEVKAGTSTEVANPEVPGENQEPRVEREFNDDLEPNLEVEPYTEPVEQEPHAELEPHAEVEPNPNPEVEPTSEQIADIEKKPRVEVRRWLERLRIIEGPRGGTRLLVGDYLYSRHSKRKDQRVVWRCSNLNYKNCKARCVTGMHGRVACVGEHNHEPNLKDGENIRILYETEFDRREEKCEVDNSD